MNLKFRDATLEDLPKIVEIYNTTIAGRMVTADTEPVSVESRIAWFESHSPEKRPLWMAENEDGKTVGWVSFQNFYGRPAYDGTVEISIYLDEHFRGKGYGKKILKYSIEKSKGFGTKVLLGFIFGHNVPSVKLFESQGFETWGFFPGVAVLDSIKRDLKILGKRVAE